MCVKSEFGVPAEIQLVEWLRAAQKTSQCPLDPFQQTLHLFLPTTLCFHWSFSFASSTLQGAPRSCWLSVRPELSSKRHFFTSQHSDEDSLSIKNQSSGGHPTSYLPSYYGYLAFRQWGRDPCHWIAAWESCSGPSSGGLAWFTSSHECCIFPESGQISMELPPESRWSFPWLNCTLQEAARTCLVSVRPKLSLIWQFFLSQHRDESSGPIWWIWVASRNFCSPLSLAMIITMLVATFLGEKLTCSTVNDSLME